MEPRKTLSTRKEFGMGYTGPLPSVWSVFSVVKNVFSMVKNWGAG